MSRTLDILERAQHGTTAGFKAGCRSKGGCPNHGIRGQLTCLEAARAQRHYFSLAVLAETDTITYAMLHVAKTNPFTPVREQE
ncbi:hypothetical protein [Microbacterium sp.]|uniref:hypothetical protein n=1 Tax=Microbacterium sp. TaxID=51671 RepID=UPI002B6B1ED1|nr:hypothetical protein [Microbacterium sp.]HWL78025.1 hypothetical protein [Microbacterium sp.]